MRDAEFTRLFFGIWLSPRTSEPRLREALLGRGRARERRGRHAMPSRRSAAARRDGWRDGLRYGVLGLPLAFVALPLYVILPNHYAASSACRWPRWARCCWRRGCSMPSSTRCSAA